MDGSSARPDYFVEPRKQRLSPRRHLFAQKNELSCQQSLAGSEQDDFFSSYWPEPGSMSKPEPLWQRAQLEKFIGSLPEKAREPL